MHACGGLCLCCVAATPIGRRGVFCRPRVQQRRPLTTRALFGKGGEDVSAPCMPQAGRGEAEVAVMGARGTLAASGWIDLHPLQHHQAAAPATTRDSMPPNRGWQVPTLPSPPPPLSWAPLTLPCWCRAAAA